MVKGRFNASADLPETLIQLWILQISLLAKRTKAPSSRSQTSALLDFACKRYGKKTIELWSSYNLERRGKTHLRVTEGEHAMAYVLAFHLNNMQRIYQVFQRIEQQNILERLVAGQNAVQLLDLGCGAGAWSAALLETLKAYEPKIGVDLIDRSRFFLKVAREGLQSTYQTQQIKVLNSDLRDSKVLDVCRKIFNLCKTENRLLIIGMSYVVNEFSAARDQRILLQLLKLFLDAPFPVALSLFEPGREKEARIAMEMRDWLVDQGQTLLYPCPAKARKCPMLRGSKDRCYSEIYNHKVPEWLYVSEILGLKRDKLATGAYFSVNPAARGQLLQRNPTAELAVARRLVGFPDSDKGALTLICEGDKLSRRPQRREDKLRGQALS